MVQRLTRAKLLLAASYLATLGWTMPTHGQTVPQTTPGDASSTDDQNDPVTASPGDQTDIVVTARKRDERLVDVPETITALSEASLARQGIRSVDDLGRTLPNVVLNRRGDNEVNVVIRGIGAFGNVQGIGFYVDDVPNFTDQASRLVDLERVEVLKGPQGTLYGGSSLGGAIKYVTRKPGPELEGRGSIELGERSTVNVNGSVNLPISDAVYARVSGYVDTNDGYLRNPLIDGNNDRSREYGVRAALRYNPTDATDIVASFRASYLNNGGNDYQTADSVREIEYVSPLDVDIYNHRTVLGGILNAQQALGEVTLTSLTSYTYRRNRFRWDLDYSPADAVTASQSSPVRTKVFTQELRLASDSERPLSWLVGAFYARTRDRLLVSKADITLGPDATGGDPVFIGRFNDATSVDQNYAGFASLTYRSGPLELTGGARLNYNRFSGTNRNIPESDVNSDTRVLPKATVSYKADPAVLLYATYSQGYEPGKLNLVADRLAPYQPERTSNFELGAKGQTEDGLLTYEIAGFYIVNKDRQFETQVLNAEGIPSDLTTNIGRSRSYGAEGAVTIRPAQGFALDLGAGYLNARYRRATFQLQGYDGNRVPYAPSFTGNAAVTYSTPIATGLKLDLRADVAHNSGFFWDIPNLARQPDYRLVGLRAALGAEDGGWELAVRADNLFDKGYNSEFLYNFAGVPASEIVGGVCDECNLSRVGSPRYVLGTFTMRF